jgi:hypothetical protein
MMTIMDKIMTTNKFDDGYDCYVYDHSERIDILQYCKAPPYPSTHVIVDLPVNVTSLPVDCNLLVCTYHLIFLKVRRIEVSRTFHA